MFERYTDRARRVVVLTQEEARNLMREGDGVGAHVLSNAGLEFSAVSHQIRELLRGRQESYLPPGERPAARLAAIDARPAVIEQRLTETT